MAIKVAYIYDVYPQDYQSYISLLMEEISNRSSIESVTYAFNAKDQSTVSLKYGLIKRAKDRIGNLLRTNTEPIYLKELEKNKHDIIHIQHSYLSGKFLDAFDSQSNNQKFVITLRGGDTYIKPWLSERWQLFYKKYGESIFFITMSEHQKAYLAKWGVPGERVFVIPISHNNKSKVDITQRLKDTDQLRIASVFRMTWEKNIQSDLLFVKKLVDKGIKVQYDLYGDGNDLGEVYYLVDRFQLHDYVDIVGKVSYEVLMEKLKDYHFVLQLSVSEALPSSILEAQSFSVPAIISDSDGLPEAVWPNESAIIRPFWEIDQLVEDTITLWSDKKRYISFCEKSYESSQRFTVDKEVERLINMYQKILGRIS